MLGDLFREGFDITVRRRRAGCCCCARLLPRRQADAMRHNRLAQTSHEDADAIVVNTCAFVDEVRGLRQPLRAARSAPWRR
jgi:hypothetical protein